MSEQSAGEWDDKTIISDTERLMGFVNSETDALVKALDNAQSLLAMIYQVGPQPAVWGEEGIENLLSSQMAEGRSALALCEQHETTGGEG